MRRGSDHAVYPCRVPIAQAAKYKPVQELFVSAESKKIISQQKQVSILSTRKTELFHNTRSSQPPTRPFYSRLLSKNRNIHKLSFHKNIFPSVSSSRTMFTGSAHALVLLAFSQLSPSQGALSLGVRDKQTSWNDPRGILVSPGGESTPSTMSTASEHTLDDGRGRKGFCFLGGDEGGAFLINRSRRRRTIGPKDQHDQHKNVRNQHDFFSEHKKTNPQETIVVLTRQELVSTRREQERAVLIAKMQDLLKIVLTILHRPPSPTAPRGLRSLHNKLRTPERQGQRARNGARTRPRTS